MSEVIGLVPAAGRATRIAPLPCSKELYPIGFRPVDGGRSVRAKAACHHLLEKMRFAGIAKAYIVLGKNKWDIPNYFGNGLMLDMNLAYLTLSASSGAPYTLDEAYPFVRHSVIAFGFPDIVFEPDDAFVRLLARQRQSEACVTLGLFPPNSRRKSIWWMWLRTGGSNKYSRSRILPSFLTVGALACGPRFSRNFSTRILPLTSKPRPQFLK